MKRRELMGAAALLLAGAALMWGRYDHAGALQATSLRSYAASLFFYTLTIPALWGLLAKLFPRKIAIWGGLGAWAIAVIPYHSLGWDAAYFEGVSRRFFVAWNSAGQSLPKLAWFPSAAAFDFGFPHGSFFFLVVGALGAGILYRSLRHERRRLRLALACFALVLFQTATHLSLRSPYTYLPHFEQTPEKEYFYHYYVFPEQRGAVNRDYHVYWDAELLFIGTPRSLELLGERLFPFYLSSQFTRFVHPFYVWLVFNLIGWAVAVGCIHSLARRWFSEEVANLSAVFAALSQGMIVYVGQPMPYAFAIAALPFLLWLYFRLLGEKRPPWENVALFGVVFGLALLTYDYQPWAGVFLLFAWYEGHSIRRTALAVAVGLLIPKAFLAMGLLFREHLTLVATLAVAAQSAGHPWTNVQRTLRQFEVPKLLRFTLRTFSYFARNMACAFPALVLPTVAGFVATRDRDRRVAMAFLLLPAFLTIALFTFAESAYTEYPRLVYPAFPAVFVLSAIALAPLFRKRAWRWIPGAIVLLAFGIGNADLFGFPLFQCLWFYHRPMP